MNLNSTLGLISTIALFLPLLMILVLRLGAYKTFPALFVYYAIILAYNMMSAGYINVDSKVVHYWGLGNNLLDVPLILTFLLYFSTSARFARRMKQVILAFILFELIVLGVMGITVNAITIILAPGLIISIGFCTMFFIRQTKITISHQKATGKALIAAALLFAYGCYAILYLIYYVIKTDYVADTFIIYFLVVTISSILVGAGIFMESKRIRHVNELKIMRRELSDIYGNEKPKNLKPAMLDFDRDQWN
jgi:hypothetical protein